MCGQPVTRMLVSPAVASDIEAAKVRTPGATPSAATPSAATPAATPSAFPPPVARIMPPPPPRLPPRRAGAQLTAPSLLDQVTVLLESALGTYGGTASGERLQRVRARLGEPLRVAMVGRVKAGKSTLLNALVGEELAPTDAGECTRVVTWYTDGLGYKATIHPRDGEPATASFTREGGAISIALGSLGADDIERIVIEWPSSALRSMSLIDTPGLASISTELSARTEATFGGDVADSPADAIVYLTRHLHPADLRFLDAFSDRSEGAPTAVIAVLSRADEVGVGRLDAMISAERVSGRYAADPRLRRICQAVIPVAGLVAAGGRDVAGGRVPRDRATGLYARERAGASARVGR